MKRILIVDDDFETLGLVKYILEKKGYDVCIEYDPAMVMATIIMYNPWLLLLDINIDGTDGKEICKMIKAKYSFPVILFSGVENLAEECKACGADGYIEKPFTIKAFLAIIKKFGPTNHA